jgi:hypothetical protein
MVPRVVYPVLSLLAGAWLAATISAQGRDPLGPQADSLKAMLGTWKLEGTLQRIEATRATDSGPVSYTQVGMLVNDGAILQVRRTGTGPRGAVEEVWRYSYDPLTKTYRMDATTTRNVIRNFVLEIEADTWSFEGTNITPAGIRTLERFTIRFSPDRSSAIGRSEHSADGKTWHERLTGTYTRIAEPPPRP